MAGDIPNKQMARDKALTTCSSKWLLAFFPVKLYKPSVFSSKDDEPFHSFFFFFKSMAIPALNYHNSKLMWQLREESLCRSVQRIH